MPAGLPGVDKRETAGSPRAEGHGQGELTASDSRPLACPYYKRDPKKYQSWRVCTGPGWKGIARLKEHLYRRHRLPDFYCPRCYSAFDVSVGLDQHMRLDPPCKKQDANQAPEGLDERQQRELRSRKVISASETNVEKWHHIYKILFPADDLGRYPSPYYDWSPSLASLDSSHVSPTSDELARFFSFIQSEHSQRRLRSDISRVLRARDQGVDLDPLVSELTQVFMNSQMDALRVVRGQIGGTTALEHSSTEMESQASYRSRATRRSSDSGITYRGGHTRPVDLGTSGSGNHTPLSVPEEGPPRASTLLSPDSSIAMGSTVVFDPFYHPHPQGLDVSMSVEQLNGLWHGDMDLPMLPYTQEAMSFGSMGAQFDMTGHSNPPSIDISVTDYPVEMHHTLFSTPMHTQHNDGNEQHHNHGGQDSPLSLGARSRTTL